MCFFYFVSSMFLFLDLLVSVSYVFHGSIFFVFWIYYRDIMFCGFYVWVSSVYVVPMSLASLLFDVWLEIRMSFVSQVFKCQISTKCFVWHLCFLEFYCIWSWKSIISSFGSLAIHSKFEFIVSTLGSQMFLVLDVYCVAFVSFRNQIICWLFQCGLFVFMCLVW